MIRHIITSILLMVSTFVAFANQEIEVKLDDKNKTFATNLGFARITCEYLGNRVNNGLVKVSIENTFPNPIALMVFRNDMTQNMLKRNTPKIEFEKNYGGATKAVTGCGDINKLLYIILPATTDSIFTVQVPLSAPKEILIPIYLAKYDAKKLNKKGINNVNYKIYEEYLCNVKIQVQGWTPQNPAYVKLKNSVEEFIASLNGVGFCTHKKHQPSLYEQQRIYLQVKDSLLSEINSTLNLHQEWYSVDPPYIAYNNLRTQLEAVDLNSHNRICEEHSAPTPVSNKVHKCQCCSLSEQEILNQLNDIYVELYAHKLSKNAAVKKANALNSCYKANKSRSQNKAQSSKINKFYNQIVNY